MNRRILLSLILVSSSLTGLSACSGSQSEADPAPVEQPEGSEESDDTGASGTVDEPEEAPEPEASAESQAAIDLQNMPPVDTAEGLAARVANAHGAQEFARHSQANFTFVVANAGADVFVSKVAWDKDSNRARVDWEDKKAKAKIAAMVHLDDPKQGWVLINDEPATEAQRKSYLEAAYARWINDSYWAFMPQKIVDPGVDRELVDDRKLDGKARRVLKLSYDEVGLTPGDTYWVWIDPSSFRVEKWEMLLEGAEPDAKPTPVLWQDYRDVSGVLVSHDHEVVGTPRRIQIRDVSFADAVDETLFTKP